MKLSVGLLASLLAWMPGKTLTAIEVWTSSENIKKALVPLAESFTQEFSEPVVITVLNKDLSTQFKTAAMANKGPDILTWAHDVVGELAASGFIEPILMTDARASEFLPVALDAFRYQGRLFGYPYNLEAVALIVNTDLMKSPPESMEALRDTAIGLAKTNPSGHFTFLYDINNFFFSYPLISAAGGYCFGNQNGGLNSADIGLDNEGAKIGANFIASLVSSKVVPSSTDRSIAFNKMTSGQLAATIDGPWALADLKRANIPFAVYPLPTLAGHKLRPFVGSQGFMIRRSSPKKELAKELVERYFVSSAGVRAIYAEDPRGPARQDVLSEVTSTNPWIAAFMESAAHGTPMPNIPQMSAVWAAAGGSLQSLTSGASTPDHAMESLAQKVRTTIAGERSRTAKSLNK